MKILISGLPNSGQLEVLQTLTKHKPTQRLQGLVLEHQFNTKYFSVNCGIWIDEMQNFEEWVDEFCSDEAHEVREAITLFIFTCGQTATTVDQPDYRYLGKFLEMLKPGSCLAIASDGADALQSVGFDVVELEELLDTVHAALYDCLDESHKCESDERDDNEEVKDHGRGEKEPHMSLDGEVDTVDEDDDLDNIVKQLVEARRNQNMTNEEKKLLADKLAEKLI